MPRILTEQELEEIRCKADIHSNSQIRVTTVEDTYRLLATVEHLQQELETKDKVLRFYAGEGNYPFECTDPERALYDIIKDPARIALGLPVNNTYRDTFKPLADAVDEVITQREATDGV
jgi:hypothetical protein